MKFLCLMILSLIVVSNFSLLHRKNTRRDYTNAEYMNWLDEKDALSQLQCPANAKESLNQWQFHWQQTELDRKWRYFRFYERCNDCPSIAAFLTHTTLGQDLPPFSKYLTCCLKNKKDCPKYMHVGLYGWMDQIQRDLSSNCGGVKGYESWKNRMKVKNYKEFIGKDKDHKMLFRNVILDDSTISATTPGTIWKFNGFTIFSYDLDNLVGDRDEGGKNNNVIRLDVNNELKGRFISSCSFNPSTKVFLPAADTCAQVRKQKYQVKGVISLELVPCEKKDSAVPIFEYLDY